LTLFFAHVCQWISYDELHFMQDGTPPHLALSIRAWLHNRFSDRWIGRGGQTWSLLNPYLLQCDFILGFWAREEACNWKARTCDELE